MDSTNTAKTVPAPAVVLMDEPEGADSSPPVGPAPDNLANLAGRIIDDDFGSDDLDNDNIDDDIFEDDRPLTPETRRQRLVALTAVLMALGEWQDALKAVLDTPESTKADDPTCWACDWYADVAHLLFFAETWRSILRGYSMGGMDDATNAECKRRREAFARGELHCGCPVLWAERALDQIVDTLEKHGEDMLGDPAIEDPPGVGAGTVQGGVERRRGASHEPGSETGDAEAGEQGDTRTRCRPPGGGRLRTCGFDPGL